MQTKDPTQTTPRQLQMLGLIAEFQNNNHYSATITELANTAGLSRTTVFEHIEELRKKGLVSSTKGKARSLTVTHRASALLEEVNSQNIPRETSDVNGIPLLGRVAAGVPIDVYENSEQISLEQLFGNRDTFALEVAGQSMIDAGINHGDYIICKTAQTARNGQLVIAVVDENAATVKRFFMHDKYIRLQPENDAFEPIISKNCSVQAHVIGLLRRL